MIKASNGGANVEKSNSEIEEMSLLRPQERPASRHRNERHRIPKRHIRGISPKHKTQNMISKIDALKEIIRAWGLNPEEINQRSLDETKHNDNSPRATRRKTIAPT
jgi:hypothetical protein